LFTRFREQGETVYGTYWQSDDLPASDLPFYHKVDVADYASVHAWIQRLEPELDRVVLINCAGISYNAFAHKADVASWERVIDVNVKGTFHAIRALLPIMREQGYGRIVNFSSVVAALPTPGVSAYAASKAALVGLTKSLAVENGSKGITVNAIHLGYVNAGMGVNDVPPAYREVIRAQIPCGRFCEPEEIYNTIRYLMETEYVNGSAIDINGGLI
jgi:NAD(P)-dependent dehydrogenase (short-subunit alcohol dehydrogenase family)